jgi:hypothetical protein
MQLLDGVLGPRLRTMLRSLVRLGGTTLLAVFVCAPAASAASEEGNWLLLEFAPFKGQAQVRLVSEGTDAATQVLTRKGLFNCGLATDGRLLGFSGSQSVGFFPLWHKGSIGIKGSSQGATCGQVRNGQFLKLQLGSDPRVAQQKVVEAELSLVIHRNVRIRIEASDGGKVVRTFEVRSGSYAKQAVSPGAVGLNCPNRWPHTCKIRLEGEDGLRWDALKLSTAAQNTGESGAWSIGGGASRFKLLDFAPEGEFDCGDTDVEAGGVLRRLDDVEGPEGDCTKLPYQLEFDGETLAFLADYGVLEAGTEPAFAFDVEWRTELVTGPTPQAVPYVPGDNPPSLPETFAQQVPFSVQWFGLSPGAEPPPGVTPYLIDYCPGQPVYTDGVLTGLTLPAGFDDAPEGSNDMSDLDGFQFGCLVARAIEIVDPQSCGIEPPQMVAPNQLCVRVKESGYLRGDWTATRTLR